MTSKEEFASIVARHQRAAIKKALVELGCIKASENIIDETSTLGLDHENSNRRSFTPLTPVGYPGSPDERYSNDLLFEVDRRVYQVCYIM